MPLNINVGGTWKTAKPYIKVGGIWKQATGYLNVGGVWKNLTSIVANLTTDPGSVIANPYSSAISSNGARSIVTDKLGNIYICFIASLTNGATQGAHIYKSSDGGATWSSLAFPNNPTSYAQSSPSIAVDANDNLHVAWVGTDSTYNSAMNVKYARYESATSSWKSWSGSTFKYLTVGNAYSQYTPAIATSPTGSYIHIVWSGYNAVWSSYSQIWYYKSGDSGDNWASGGSVINNITYNQDNPSIAVDASGYVSIAWAEKNSFSPSRNVIAFNWAYNNGDTFTGKKTAVSDGTWDCTEPCVAVDASGHAHISYTLQASGGNRIQYVKHNKDNGMFVDHASGFGYISGYNQGSSTIMVDASGGIHIMWFGLDTGSQTYYQIKYSYYDGVTTPVSFSAWVNKTSQSFFHVSPSLCITAKNVTLPLFVYRNSTSQQINFMGAGTLS
jgi:hypothetical protein